ncbi:MAG TPA: dihydroorotase [Acidobacteriaceae bacterium]|nr:dihydroorotase [Acidobacteriaceae bacterium]
MRELLITGGRVVDPANGVDAERDVLVRDGKIAAIEEPGVLAEIKLPKELQIDATGCVVTPGFIDVHVHLREPGQTHKETIATGTDAAAAGGFTTVVAMPNTTPVNDSVAGLEWMLDEARGARVHLLAMPAATAGSMGERVTDFAALVKVGAVGFTDDGKPVLEDEVMRAALMAAARLGVPVSQHAEDTRLTGGCSMNAGPVAFRLGLRGMTVEAEVRIVERDIRLLEEIEKAEGLRPHLHVQHVSTSAALRAIREAKERGLYVTCEAAPHHFTLTDEAIGEYNTNAKMNPPLRCEADRRALIAAVMDGTVDCIATDHAPHASHEKEVEFERAPNGITGLETALGLALRVLHRENGLPLGKAIELMTAKPAAVIGLKDRGALRVGGAADLAIFDAGAEWQFRARESRSMSKNTPFDGAAMLGRIKATVCGGRVVYCS